MKILYVLEIFKKMSKDLELGIELNRLVDDVKGKNLKFEYMVKNGEPHEVLYSNSLEYKDAYDALYESYMKELERLVKQNPLNETSICILRTDFPIPRTLEWKTAFKSMVAYIKNAHPDMFLYRCETLGGHTHLCMFPESANWCTRIYNYFNYDSL